MKQGQIVDSTLMSVPRQRNTREEHVQLKTDEVPSGWESQPSKLVPKDVDARGLQKHGEHHYGYKNHVSVDREHQWICKRPDHVGIGA